MMGLNETREKIIELISDYMDKTLEFGCLVKHKNRTFTVIEDFGSERLCIAEDGTYQFENTEIEAIGIYDITAVFDYINCNSYKFDLHYCYDGYKNQILEIYIDNEIKCIGNIPNKPLTLFTETEERELLTLLEGLK